MSASYSIFVQLFAESVSKNLMADALAQVQSKPADVLKRPLKIKFVGEEGEREGFVLLICNLRLLNKMMGCCYCLFLCVYTYTGIDAGGVKKEFFQLIVKQILDPMYGMFVYSEETRTFWFNLAAFDMAQEFALVGTIMGLAIYNGVIIDLPFPQIVYKVCYFKLLVWLL